MIKDGQGQERRRIGRRYRLEDQIGRGGMATVFRAHDEQLDRKVALKIMRAELGEDPQFVARFEAEARHAASVSHPNVVAVYDVGTDGSPYMVMELVDGGDVASAIAENGRMEPARAAAVAAQTAGALQAAHEAGLVHRDVKPGNILLEASGRARVADFGIARATGEDGLTRTGATLGSVEYFSPEQARGEHVSPASDIYALGVVLYEMLTGQRAFTGESPYAVATARLAGPPPDPRTVVPTLPPDLAEVAMRAMALEPAERFESADAMRQALLGWLEQLGDGEPGPIAAAAVPAGSHPQTAPAPATSIQPATRPESAAAIPDDRIERRRTRRAWLLPAALALGALLVASYLGGRFLIGQSPDQDELPGVVVGSPGGGVVATMTPSPSPTPTASPAETASPQGTPVPVPATASPAPTPPPVAAATPSDAVAAFYDAVEDGRFDDAYALWSARMRDAYPRQGNLDDRFADTADITFTDLFVADQSASAATVQANFVETYDSGDSQQFVGYWRLVRVDGRWLLDEPTY